MATKYGRSNGSFHRVFACSAGGPGFDSRLRRINRVSQLTAASEQRMLSDALCRGCRWPWSSPYIVVTPTWCRRLSSSYSLVARDRASSSATRTLLSHRAQALASPFGPPRVWCSIRVWVSYVSATIPSLRHRGLWGSCSSTSRGSEWQLITPFEWLFA